MHVDLKLGLSCNNSCIHCIMEPIRKNLINFSEKIDSNFDNICKIIEESIHNGATSITLTGGEPTLRKDFFEILNECLQHENMEIIVQTNARLLSSEYAKRQLEGIKKRNVTFVIAIHGNNSIIHDSITKRPGSFDETMKSISLLNDMKYNLCGKMVLSKLNVEYISKTVNVINQSGIDDVIVAYPHAEEFPLTLLRAILPEYSTVKKSLSKLKVPFAPGKCIKFETIPFCMMPSIEFYPHSIDFDLLRDSLANNSTFIEMSMIGTKINWNESRKTIKKHARQCHNCLLSNVCEGVWDEYFNIYSENVFSPIQDKLLIEQLLEKI